jgi:hypothetical protein
VRNCRSFRVSNDEPYHAGAYLVTNERPFAIAFIEPDDLANRISVGGPLEFTIGLANTVR